ncbi:unnamed protein product [Scytosiphon promiscuus]
MRTMRGKEHADKRKAKLHQMAALCRLASKSTDHDIATLRGMLDHIAADKRDGRLFSPRVPLACSTQNARTYGEFVCSVEDSPKKGKGEVLTLTRDSDFGRISNYLHEAFHLTGGVLITVPEDRLFDEMEQLVLSTKHLRSLLDDFAVRQPTRRALKVMKALLPITRCLVRGHGSGPDEEGRTALALNQLLELVQVPANVETVDGAGRLNELLGALRSVIGHDTSPTHVAVACHVVWRLAASAGMRRRLMEHGIQDKLWVLAEKIARAVETPEHQKAREKAAQVAAEGLAGLDRSSAEADGNQESLLLQEAIGDDGAHDQEIETEGEQIVLEAGNELDELATKCVGAVSLILRSPEAADALATPDHREGLSILLELATVALGRGGIGDERVPCMAAEALAHVLVGDGKCRMTWAEQGKIISLLDLMRSPLRLVVLCGASILNAFLRGKPSQIAVTSAEAAEILQEAAPACRRCLDQLEFKGSLATAHMPGSAAVDRTGAGVCRPLHASMDAETQECIAILEQATATCWGSLAVIDRCTPGPEKKPISLACWFPTMLAVTKLADSKHLSPWVTFCAVACIGVGIGAGTNLGTDALTEMENLPGDLLGLLKRPNSMELQQHAARTLCTLLSANVSLRQRALQDGFLDKMQHILIGRLGSPQLDSTIACSIMFLCDVWDQSDSNSDERVTGSPGGSCRARRKKRSRRSGGSERAAKGDNGPDWTAWSDKQLTSLVWALGHSNQDVLTYTSWTVWLLARRPQNRVSLGRLWAVDGLVHALKSNARLDVKEGLLAAIWLIACDAGNTARLALNGGLQILVGVLNFPCSACYVPLKTLAVGTLCKLCRTEPDVATLTMHLSIAPALLQGVFDGTSTVYLKVLSAGLVFTLCRNSEHEKNRADFTKQFTAEGGPFVLEEICAEFLASDTSELQACGSFFAASLSVGARSRHHLQDNGGLEALCRHVRAKNTKEALRTRSLHALLNLSTETGCQPSICRWTLQPLVDLTISGKPPQSEFASSILCNCVDNPWCRAIMFEGQLARGSEFVTASRADEASEESIRSSPSAGGLKSSKTSTARIVRERFLSWVKEVKEGASDTPPALCAGGGRGNAQAEHGVSNGGGAEKPETDPARDHRTILAKPSRTGEEGDAKRGGRVKSEPSTSLKRSDRGVDAMVQVRQNFRQPVTSLWQSATERAKTAPTRSIPKGGRLEDGTNAAPRRRPHSQIFATKAKGGALSISSVGAAAKTTDAPEEIGNERQHVGGKGATVHSADGGNRGISRRHTSRDGEPAKTSVIKTTGCAVPGYCSGGQVIGGHPQGRKTPIPLRSSHRLGPVGSLGSTSLPAGEYRWKPFVSDCYTKPNPLPAWRRLQKTPPEGVGRTRGDTRGASPLMGAKLPPASSEPTKEERDAIFNQAVKENQTVIVVEPPLDYKLVFDGPTNVGPAKPSVNPVSMTLFPHVRGASVCGPLYDHYVAEDGLCYHLYHTSRVICEVLDPGGYPPLSDPTELRHVLHKTLPEAPPPDYPSGRPDAKPVLYLPPPRECPPITSHYISSCELACRQGHGDVCPGARCKMFGAMPSDFMVFEVNEQPQVEEDEGQPATLDVHASKWDVNHSIFAPRRKESESRTFWDTERVVRKALDTDFGRMLKEDRIIKLMGKCDNEVVKGQKAVAESLEEVKKVIAPVYKIILCIFNYYCLTPSQSIRGAFSIQPNQFGRMMQDADFAGNFISVEEIGKIFVLVNFETDKRSAEATVNEDRALMRFELLEALLRVALTMRDNEGQEEMSPAEKMHDVLEDQLFVNLPPESMEDPDTFRSESLYTEACDSVLQDHQKALGIAYQKYSLLNPVAGKPSFGLEEWKTFTIDARLVGDSVHMLRMGLRDIKQPFYLARMMVSDEIKSRTKLTQLTFVDFLESLVRLANVIPVPSDEDMQEVKVTDVLDYESALSVSDQNSPAQQDAVARAMGGALTPRLDRLIRYVIGTLAIRSNGVLKAGNKSMNLVGLYCTKEHLARGILPS